MIRTAALIGAVIGAGLLSTQSASAQAFGGFRASCTDIDQRGPIVTARCREKGGGFRQTSIDARACGGSGIGNNNGRLTCEGGGGRASGRDEAYGRESRRDDGYGRQGRDDGGYGRRPRSEDYEERPRGYGPPRY